MKKPLVVPVEISARHVHLTPDDFRILFGNEAKLKLARDISEPGQFAAVQRVTLQTPKSVLEDVRVVGPLRTYSQVELARTDAVSLGLTPPVRRSHELNLDGTPGVTIVGQKGMVKLEKGVIVPWRHLHLSNTEALEYGLKKDAMVKVRIHGERAVIFENVLVDVDPSFRASLHLDTDEGNAAGVNRHAIGEIMWS